MQLELEDVGQKVAGVGRVARHVVLGAGIEVLLGPFARGADALVLLAQAPPGGVVLLRRHITREHGPAPAIDQQTERQEGHLVERHAHQQAEVGVRGGFFIEQPDVHQVARGYREGDHITQGLVEAVVGTVTEQRRPVPVAELVVAVTEFVVDRREVLGVDVDAHLDPHVLVQVELPGAGVADDLAVPRLDELGTRPERVRQRLHAQRGEEALGHLDHLDLRGAAALEDLGQVVTRVRGRRRHQVVDVRPALRPHVAENVCRDRTRGIDDVRPVVIRELRSHMALQVVVKRLDLVPEPVDLGREVIGRHVVLRTPHGAGVGEPEIPRALVREFHETLVVGAHRRRDRPPTLPGVEQRIGVAAVVDHVLQVAKGSAGVRVRAVRAVLARAVGRFHPRSDLTQFLDLRLVGRRGQGQSAPQQVELARHLVRLRRRVVGRRLLREVDRAGQRLRSETGRQGGRVLVDVRRLHPCRAAAVVVVLDERLLGRRRELGRRRALFARAAGQEKECPDGGRDQGGRSAETERRRQHGVNLHGFGPPCGRGNAGNSIGLTGRRILCP